MTTPDKATGGRTEAAAVDQAIADVEHWVREQTNPLSTPRSRTEAKDRGRAALRVLADAVEELRGDRDEAERLYDEAEQRITAMEAERDRLLAEKDIWHLDVERLARQVADLEAALQRIAGRYCLRSKGDAQADSACLDKPSDQWCSVCIARAALVAARSRDPQEPQT